MLAVGSLTPLLLFPPPNTAAGCISRLPSMLARRLRSGPLLAPNVPPAAAATVALTDASMPLRRPRYVYDGIDGGAAAAADSRNFNPLGSTVDDSGT